MFQNISADRLETLLDQGRAFTLADVREPEDTGRDIWREL